MESCHESLEVHLHSAALAKGDVIPSEVMKPGPLRGWWLQLLITVYDRLSGTLHTVLLSKWQCIISSCYNGQVW
jgi:hypothetical protein